MSTYIKYVFKYLFQADQLSAAELEAQGSSGGAASGSVMSNISGTLSATSISNLSGARQRMKCLEVARLLARETTAKLTTVPNVTSSSSVAGSTHSVVAAAISIPSASASTSASASASAPGATTNQPAQHLRSFADFEAAIKQASGGNRSELDLSLPLLPSSSNEQTAENNSRLLGEAGNQYKTLDLFECFNQLQLQDYYSGYDIFVGLRIASTLTILFVVFILFVIYKTGCRDNTTTRSQLALSTSYKEKEKDVEVISERQAYIRRLNAEEANTTRCSPSRRPQEQTRTHAQCQARALSQTQSQSQSQSRTEASETSPTNNANELEICGESWERYRDWPG